MGGYLFLNGLRFHYEDWGGTGRPLVLLHGLASNTRIWRWLAPALAAQHRVLALDQRHHGLTDPAEDGFDFPSLAKDLHAFVDTLQLEKPVVVGHSWGANVALHYAAKRPLPPAGVVLVDGGLGTLNERWTWEQAETMLQPPDIDGLPREAFIARVRGTGGPLREALLEVALGSVHVDEDDRVYRRLPIPKHMRIARAIYDQPTADLLGAVRCPTLLCPAYEDDSDWNDLKRAATARAQAANPRVRVHPFPDTIHDVPVQRPAELAQAIATFVNAL